MLSPVALTANALEYVDRACTFSVIVLIVAHLIAWRRPAMTPAIKRVLVLGGIWFVGTFALTIFVPTRSSLYALLPRPRQRCWPGSCCSSCGMPRGQ